jgi:tetratricopeptide (TPR) repeat protein
VRDAAHNQPLQIALAALTLALIAVILLPFLLPSVSREEFTVLVAPFGEDGGPPGPTGRAVAEALVTTIPEATGRRVVTQALAEPPANPEEAAEILARHGADILLWGQVRSGALLDDASLLPEIAYQPTGALAAMSWDGYADRFALPSHYRIATQPVNGSVVVPQFLGALADYSAGRVDGAVASLDALAASYPQLAPVLPAALRGNTLWARGEYRAAADEYRRAIAASPQTSDVALLYNNLGAILQDDRQPEALAAFNQAATILAGAEPPRDLGALRYNFAVESLRADRTADAIRDLEQAQRLIQPPSTPLLLTLSRAYRLAGQLDPAAVALDQAAERAAIDDIMVPTDLRALFDLRLRALVAAERIQLGLAQSTPQHGPVLWNLEVSEPLPTTTLQPLRDRSDQLAETIETLTRRWNERSAAEDANGSAIAGRIAVNQAQRAAQLAAEQQQLSTLLDIELVRSEGTRPTSGLAGLWSALTGSGTPITRIRTALERRIANDPQDVDSVLLLGRALLLTGDEQGAEAQYTAAAVLAPERPEPIYGQALAALPNDRARGLALLETAIGLDPTYFPARVQLAQLAEADRNWIVALRERRWLAQNRPSAESSIALAQALRESGSSGYAEAEQVLLQLASQNNVDALLELSRLYRAYGDLSAARAMIDSALQLTPRGDERYPEVAYTLGDLFLQQNNIAEAEIQFESALSADPRHIPSQLALAKLNTGDLRIATRYYQAALDAGADDPATLTSIGATLLAYREHELAATAFERAVAAEPNNAAAHYGLAQAYLRLNRLDAAAEQARLALEAAQGSFPPAQVILGDVALARSDLPSAVEQYNIALRQNGGLAAGSIGLGRASASEGNWAVALGHFRRAAESDPNLAEAQLWLGEALFRTGDLSGAQGTYTRAIELRADYPEALFGLAQVQSQLGDISAAEQSLEAALRLRPDYSEALLVRGRLYEQQGQDARALETYTRAVDSGGRLAEPRFRRALLHIRAARLDDARSDLIAAISIQEQFPEAHYWLGRVHFAQGRYTSAATSFRTAVAQRGSYAEARFYQGLAEERDGQRAEAAASYRAAAEQGRDTIWAEEALAALNRLGSP